MVPRYFIDVAAFYIHLVYTRYEIQQVIIEYDTSTTTLNVTPTYILPGTASAAVCISKCDATERHGCARKFGE